MTNPGKRVRFFLFDRISKEVRRGGNLPFSFLACLVFAICGYLTFAILRPEKF
ncbi:potassium-transporting ATPase subunit F [Leptospira wolffii]|uniref:Potassium-transporting ATPase subunit F n=1 Tax=Leptospira wolffii TaxID=409998 RepID=A0ABV5BQ19_9LEPT